MLPDIAAARRKYFESRDAADLQRLEAIEKKATDLHARHGAIVDEMQEASGIPEDVFAELERIKSDGVSESRTALGELTKEKILTTGDIDEVLADSVERLRSLVNSDWLDGFAGAKPRLSREIFEQPLSLVRGLRPESELPLIHRHAQALFVAQDYLDGNPAYDHFAGAMLVPQIAMLGNRLDILNEVGGEVEDRIRSLWRGPSQETDSTVFELLVAAGCARKGRNVEFLTPQSGIRTPDLRCHDPFPILIECKRKRSLSDYELDEERKMRGLFERLNHVARDKGVWGCFDLKLWVEVDEIDQDDVVRCLIQQRLSAHPERPLDYGWGKVEYRELPRRLSFPSTRMYSPNM